MAMYLIIMAVITAFFLIIPSLMQSSRAVSASFYEKHLKDGDISRAEISQNAEVPTGKVSFTLKDDTEYVVNVTNVNDAIQELEDHDISYTVADVSRSGEWSTILIPFLLGVLLVVILAGFLARSAGGANNANSRMMDFGKSHAAMTNGKESKVRFADVAGLEEEKEDLVEIVDFLKNPSKYTKVGARIPKGVILVGPPGTGKTLLAKAVAGEAGVPFFSISGSDFVEMFVGVGASRVRDLFSEAKKNAPCIVFIDEIDAVGRRRGTGMGGGHDEREQTLNQLLVEMDGFGVNEGIIVMAATNRVDILDPAILRPGRFDRKVVVSPPDIRGREEILKVHAKNKPLGDDIDLKQIAQTTAGFTGADLENLLNEAAIHAARDSRAYVRQDDIKDAFIKVGIGTEKKSRVISEKEKKITAYHETGHAILFHVLDLMEPVYTISIIPTGPGAAGYTMPQPENDEMFMTRGKMLQQIIVDLGGRAAEEMVFDDITTGASQDIKQATATARAMITKYGMSPKLGLVNYDQGDSNEVFIGRDWGHTKSYSENVAAAIDEEVKEIIENCHSKAREIIEKHRFVLDECAKQLMEKEKLNRKEFEAIFAEEAKTVAEGAAE
ncbi:MAG: ATP-dependent zinc metalloprotease FtsH [Bilifractor sp.]|nr:ATP-dependent zinc metalloprotease FtsH [Lachnospiraceae bacterium]MDY2838307.1 ATP-dependent zinc metalloprotease FtsH [Bilifractor sp.]